MKIVKGISEEERDLVIEWAYHSFKDVINKSYFVALIKQETNWNVSAKLIGNKNVLLGVYLLGDKQLNTIFPENDYSNLKGVEGVLLAVDKSIRGKGWGNKLKDYPKSLLQYDYIWGQQLKSLDNLTDWLKRRILIGETESVYITLELFNRN